MFFDYENNQLVPLPAGNLITEGEWLTSPNPGGMLHFLRGRASNRKLLLFGVACCRRFWDLLADGRTRRAVELVEQVADTGTGSGGLQGILPDTWQVEPRELSPGPVGALLAANWLAVGGSSCDPESLAFMKDGVWAAVVDCASAAALVLGSDIEAIVLREIFGNPFRPLRWEVPWVSAKAVTMAQSIYAQRAFDRLPELADLLQRDGCTSAEVLGHCRQPAEHARGCWILDGIIGKE